MNINRWLLAVGFVLSAVLLGVVLWRLEWAVFVAELRRLSYSWLAGAIACIVAGVALRSFRWTLAAGAPLSSYRSFWNAATIGLLANQLYPLRAGEVVRIFAVRAFAQMPLGKAGASALIDRLADMLLVGACTLAVVVLHSGLPYAEKLAMGTLTLSLGALFLLAAFVRGDRLWRSLVAKWSAKAPARLRERIERLYAEAHATSALLGSARQVFRLIAVTILIFAFDFSVMYCALEAFGWSLPPMAAATVMVFLAIGTSLPSAPGFVGVFQVACVLSLALYGIDESRAVAYSIVLQACVLLTVVVLSAWVFAAHVEEMRSVRGALNGVK